MPRDSTPRIVARLIARPPGSIGAFQRARHEHADGGVRRAADDLQLLVAARVDDAHAQAIGIGVRRRPCRCCADDDVRERRRGRRGLLDLEARHRQLVAKLPRSISGGSHSVRSQCSENFIVVRRYANCSEKAQVVLVEQPQVVHAVAQHREPVRPHAEREALVLLGIDVRRRAARSDGPDPTPAISSQPPSPNAMSISADGSVNGKNDGRKRTLQVVALEEAAQESR